MPFSHKSPEQIELLDLQNLIENKVQESKVLDYKLRYGWADKEKRELLADISSLANTAGGYLVIGVREEEGLPKEIQGTPINNADIEKLKILNLLSDGLEPRLPSVSIKMIAVGEENYAIVISVAKSWTGPHVVVFDKHWRVYARNSGGKYPLDVAEMRQAFLMSETLADTIRRYHAHRVGLLAANETACPLNAGAKIFLNIIPFSAFSSGLQIDLGAHKRENRSVPILGATYANVSRFNIDGILSIADYGNTPEAFTQIFRNGVAETAYVDKIYGGNRIAADYYEQYVIRFVEAMIDLYRIWEIPPPFVVLLNLLEAKGHSIYYERGVPGYFNSIDRNMVNLPEVIFNDYSLDIGDAMKPAYDAMWNAAGWEKSPNYNAQGERIQGK